MSLDGRNSRLIVLPSQTIDNIRECAYTYSVRNLDVSIRISLKSRPSERFPRPEMSQIKAEISLHSNLKLIFHKNVGWQGYQWIP